jgi:hypothetical protein
MSVATYPVELAVYWINTSLSTVYTARPITRVTAATDLPLAATCALCVLSASMNKESHSARLSKAMLLMA